MEIYIAEPKFAALLEEIDPTGASVRVTANGATYLMHVVRLPDDERADIRYTPDPERVREALHKYAGTWSDIDADELIETLYRAREEGSRPVDRP